MTDTPAPNAPNPAPSSGAKRFATIALADPIQRGETVIERLTIRKPRAGELRGLALQDLLSTDITALLKLIPRVSDPPLTGDEADALDPADLSEIAGAIRDFFMTQGERAMLEAVIAAHQPKS